MNTGVARARRAFACLGVLAALSSCGASTGLREPLDGPVATFPYRSYAVSRDTAPFQDATMLSGAAFQLANQDDNAVAITLPFAFGASPNAVYTNMALPDTRIQGGAVLAFWDDMYTGGGSRGVATAVTGATGARQFLATWDNVTFCCDGASTLRMSVTVVLHEGSDVIEVLYRLRSTDGRVRGNNATFGVQNEAATVATQFSLNAAAIDDGMRLRYVPQS